MASALLELEARCSGLELASEDVAVSDGLSDGQADMVPVPRR